jgi:hypothetical protein
VYNCNTFYVIETAEDINASRVYDDIIVPLEENSDFTYYPAFGERDTNNTLKQINISYNTS